MKYFFYNIEDEIVVKTFKILTYRTLETLNKATFFLISIQVFEKYN